MSATKITVNIIIIIKRSILEIHLKGQKNYFKIELL